MPMRSAMLLSNSFRPDPRVLKEARGLALRGHQISIICWDRARELPPYESHFAGVEVHRIQHVPSSYGLGAGQVKNLLRFWRAIVPVLDQIQPDLIHCHDFDTLPIGLLWGKLHRRPVIYDAHEHYADLVKPRLKGTSGTLMYWFIAWSELVGARLSSAVITVDDVLSSVYSRHNRHVEIIGHYPESSMAQETPSIFTHPEIRLVYVGRLSSDRGILKYSELVRRARQLGIPARLILAGVFTPPSEEIAFQASLSGIENAVDNMGWLPYARLPAVLRSCDIGLCVLNPEERYIKALPVKLFEYMACGLPVIVSNFPAIANIVEGVGCGALIDPQRGVDDIIPILEHWRTDPSNARRLGENGRQAVLSEYNWENLIDRLDSLYRSLG